MLIGLPGMASASTAPHITGVSVILPVSFQNITITGSGFGTHAPYTGDSEYISFEDVTQNWTAGFNGNGFGLNIFSWTPTRISIKGFNHATPNAGDELQFKVWNPQTDAGPAIFSTHVFRKEASAPGAPRISSVGVVAAEPLQNITITGSGFGGSTRPGVGNAP